MGSHGLGGACARLAFVAALLVASTGCCGTCPPPPAAAPAPVTAPASPPAGPAQPAAWTKLGSTAALDAVLQDARRLGRPTVVFVFAQWCTYCLRMTEVFERDAGLRATLARAHTVVLDVTADEGDEKRIGLALRSALGIPPDTQPYMAFVDATGTRRPDLDINGYFAASFRDVLAARLAALGLRD